VKDTQESILELGKEHDKKIYSEPEEKKGKLMHLFFNMYPCTCTG